MFWLFFSIWVLVSLNIWLVCGIGPVRAMARVFTYWLAGFYLLQEMWKGAILRRDRWDECLQRAKWSI